MDINMASAEVLERVGQIDGTRASIAGWVLSIARRTVRSEKGFFAEQESFAP